MALSTRHRQPSQDDPSWSSPTPAAYSKTDKLKRSDSRRGENKALGWFTPLLVLGLLSSQFAHRFCLYLNFHELVGKPASLLFSDEKAWKLDFELLISQYGSFCFGAYLLFCCFSFQIRVFYAAISLLVDPYYYGRWTSSILYLLVYNVLGGGESHLYGVEGPLFYARNGFNNFNSASFLHCFSWLFFLLQKECMPLTC
ncbi:hypothetical protein SAY86_016259 [Trapa natans]|uniref:Uncharacterized protein n=1 Tax=Trapa natans TaxID=22666 RepID=A0AAN7L971_TRANT|nr:hypothetical protein SAY86_016259 [Trapa natans]